VAIRNSRAKMVIFQKTGRSEWVTFKPPSYLGSDFARRTCCKPSRLVLVASPPCTVASLIGLKGVLNSKVQVKTRRDVTF
jgi:hypothetical protein